MVRYIYQRNAHHITNHAHSTGPKRKLFTSKWRMFRHASHEYDCYDHCFSVVMLYYRTPLPARMYMPIKCLKTPNITNAPIVIVPWRLINHVAGHSVELSRILLPDEGDCVFEHDLPVKVPSCMPFSLTTKHDPIRLSNPIGNPSINSHANDVCCP